MESGRARYLLEIEELTSQCEIANADAMGETLPVTCCVSQETPQPEKKP